MKFLFFVISCFLFFGHIYGEAIRFDSCTPDPNPDCEIHEVRVTPCKEVATNQPCKVKKGQTANISFDFTPQFAGSLTSQAYWAKSVADLPYAGMDTNGCKFTTCPLEVGTRMTYAQPLHMAKSFPVNTYDVKWKTWNEEGKMCCFKIKIKLTR